MTRPTATTRGDDEEDAIVLADDADYDVDVTFDDDDAADYARALVWQAAESGKVDEA